MTIDRRRTRYTAILRNCVAELVRRTVLVTILVEVDDVSDFVLEHRRRARWSLND